MWVVIMRHVSLSALLVSAVALSACGGGGGSLTADTLAVCGVNDARPACNPKVDPPPPPPPPPVDTGGGPGSGTPVGSNSTRLGANEDKVFKAIILENSKLKATEANPGLARLTVTTTANTGDTDDTTRDVTTAQIEIDTEQDDAANAAWPKSKKLDEFVSGSEFDDYNMGAGDGYKEFRNGGDEILQYWNFGDSQIAQYRSAISGVKAGQQAWTFGGTKVSNMPTPATGGTLTYTGRYGATAETSNWTDRTDPNTTVSANNPWSITGSASSTVNFTNSSFKTKLTPETWTTTDKDVVEVRVSASHATDEAGYAADPNYYGYMNDKVYINGSFDSSGTITGNAVMSTAEDTNNNNVPDDAKNDWTTTTTTNPFYGAFFGDGATSAAGVFNLEAVNPYPIGGDTPNSNNREGRITMSGALHVSTP
jgi:C-lobe and N-lobe beta barrels of Tf-binding protein B